MTRSPLTWTSVKTKVGPRDLHLGAALVDDPTLRWGAIAIVSITGVRWVKRISEHNNKITYICTGVPLAKIAPRTSRHLSCIELKWMGRPWVFCLAKGVARTVEARTSVRSAESMFEYGLDKERVVQEDESRRGGKLSRTWSIYSTLNNFRLRW